MKKFQGLWKMKEKKREMREKVNFGMGPKTAKTRNKHQPNKAVDRIRTLVKI